MPKSEHPYWVKSPQQHPQTVQFALIAAVEKFEFQREFALRHYEALELAEELCQLAATKGEVDYHLAFPQSGALQGVLFTARLQDEESFRLLEPLLEHCLEKGWKIGEGSDYPEIGRRSFQCVKSLSKSTQIYLTISGFIKDSNATCKMVEDGVETKYRFLCEDAV